MYRSDAHPAQKLIPSRSRWLATLVLVAVVAAWFLISTPTPAEAALWWSATLTTGTSTGSATSSIEGFSADVGADYGSLSDDIITITIFNTYTITRLNRDGANLIFDTDLSFSSTQGLKDVHLVVGPNIYRLKDATKVGSRYTWARTEDELEDLFIFEQDTEVALIAVPNDISSLTAVPAADPRQVKLAWIGFADVSVTKHQYRQKKGSEGYGAWIDIPSSFYPHGTNVNSYTVTNLDAVEYTFQIRAVNRIGASGTWNEATRRRRSAAVPGAPRNLGASPRDGSAQLTWEAPASNGGSAITGYQYQQKEGNGDYGDWQEMTSSDVDTRSYDVPGLTNGIRYGFKIRALNTAGAGSPSAEASATPQPLIAGAWSYETVLEPATITPGGGVVAQVKFRAKFQADQGSLTSLSARVTSGGALNMGAPPGANENFGWFDRRTSPDDSSIINYLDSFQAYPPSGSACTVNLAAGSMVCAVTWGDGFYAKSTATPGDYTVTTGIEDGSPTPRWSTARTAPKARRAAPIYPTRP